MGSEVRKPWVWIISLPFADKQVSLLKSKLGHIPPPLKTSGGSHLTWNKSPSSRYGWRGPTSRSCLLPVLPGSFHSSHTSLSLSFNSLTILSPQGHCTFCSVLHPGLFTDLSLSERSSLIALAEIGAPAHNFLHFPACILHGVRSVQLYPSWL